MKDKTRNIVFTALFAAIIAVFTAFVKINTPGGNGGYMHFGDSMIYLAASLLPPPFSICAASIGGAFADIIAGSPQWVPATAIVKALNVVPFMLIGILRKPEQKNKILNKATIGLPIVSGLITVLGYFLATVVMFGSPGALASLPANIIQAVGSALVFYGTAYALDTAKFKQRFASLR